MKCLHITDTYTIKQAGFGDMFTVQNYHTLDNALLTGEEAELFNLELDNIVNLCKDEDELDNKLDILCGQFV